MKNKKKYLVATILFISITTLFGPYVKQQIVAKIDKGIISRIKTIQRDQHNNSLAIANLNTFNEKLRTGLRKGLFFDFPPNQYIFQQHKNKSNIPYSIVTMRKYNSLSICLKKIDTHEIVYKNTIVQIHNRNIRGLIKDVPIGFYDLYIMDGEKSDYYIHKVGVGNVFLVAGQSNAMSSAQNHPPYYSKTGLVSVNALYKQPVKNFNQFIIPLIKSPIRSNISWLYCGDLLVEKYSMPVSFINVAAGSTNTNKWNPETDFLFNRIKKVLESRNVKAILWHQGESDFIEKIPYEVSYENMKKMITESQKINPETKWFIALNSMKTNQPLENIEIRKAQKAIIETGLAFTGPDTDVLRKNDKWVEPSGGHFVGEGLRRHGELWFEVLSHYLDSEIKN